MPKASKKELQRLSKDHKTQLLISKFVSDDLDILYPKFDTKKGFRYPIIDDILGDSSGTETFLGKLFDGSVLERKLYDKIVQCPACNSANVSIHYTCPHCKSFDIKKSALVEHIKCGYIDTEDHFFQKDNKLVCPRCKKELLSPNVDYHKAGVWCNCNQCNKNFDIPVPTHFCRECDENFTFDEAIYKDVYSYTLSPEAAKESNIGFILTVPVMDFLEKLGYEVESPGFLTGKSGTRHMFDLAAIKPGKKRNTTVIDIVTSTDDIISEQSVTSMFAKIFDTTPDNACLVAIPKMSKNGKNLASLYKIDLVEAKDQNSAIEALKVCVNK
jgi:transcription elongation factor Elf1